VQVANLDTIQGEKMATPTLLISDQVGGLEDIPQGVVAVVVDGGMDVLSHVAIRARNQVRVCGSLLSSAFDRFIHGRPLTLSRSVIALVGAVWLWYYGPCHKNVKKKA